MKKEDLKRETSRIVEEHLANGWLLDWDDTSRGCQTCHVLLKDEKVRFVYATWETDLYDESNGDSMEIGIAETGKENRNRCGVWNDKDSIIYRKSFYRMGDSRKEGWYTDDLELAKTAWKKHCERIRLQIGNNANSKILNPSDGLLEAMRKVPCFEKATRKNLRVEKTFQQRAWSAGKRGYKVTLLNRVGNPKSEAFYPLG